MDVMHKLFAATCFVATLSMPSLTNASSGFYIEDSPPCCMLLLEGRDLDGNISTAEAYYDPYLDITWLANANAAVNSIYDTASPGTGAMNWDSANNWVTSLDIGGITGWRLPHTLIPDATCDYNDYISQSYGYNCKGSELGHMFYTWLGGVAGSSITSTHNANYDLFSNIQFGLYGSSEYTSDTLHAWMFDFRNGNQILASKSPFVHAWAVHDGEVGTVVSAVPVPTAAWLFGSGLIFLIGVAKGKHKPSASWEKGTEGLNNEHKC